MARKIRRKIKISQRLTRLLLIPAMLLAIPLELGSESLTLSTTYPSPAGIYSFLTAVQTAAFPASAVRMTSSVADPDIALTNTSAAGRDWRIISAGTGSGVPSSFRIYDFTASADRLVINSAGNVGIGNVAPLGPLAVGNSAVVGSDGYIVLGKNTGGGTRHTRIGYDAVFNFTIGDYGNSNTAGTWVPQLAIAWNAPANNIYVNSAGNVGIGTTAPGAKLEVNGNFRQSGVLSCATLGTDATGLLNCASDERVKNILAPFQRGIESLQGIKPVTFSYKKDSGLAGTFTGFTAQNVQKKIPEAVNVQKDGLLSLDTRPILATLVNAVQQQQHIIERIQAQNEQLETTNNKLQTRLYALESKLEIAH